MASTTKEVATEILHYIRVYKDGSVERLAGSPPVPPSPEGDPDTGVFSKDITISANPAILARLFLPPGQSQDPKNPARKLPVLVYFHGGGFFFESAFSAGHHRYLNSLVSRSSALAVSVEYRLAPEHPLPIGYQDCWFALNWVASHASNHQNSTTTTEKEPWLSDHGDFERLFIGGDSAGANIVHNLAMRAGGEALSCGAAISGAFLTHPYFWGSQEPANRVPGLTWDLVYPGVPGGLDSHMINPTGPDAPSLAGLGCGGRVLVSVAEKDELRERGRSYYEALKESGWRGEVELVDVEGEDHAFQILCPETQNAKWLINRLARFLMAK